MSRLAATFLQPAGAFFKLIATRVNQFPYRLFGLLVQNNVDDRLTTARGILGSSRCMMDDFTRDFVAKFPSENELVSAQALASLQLLSQKLWCSTFPVETGHSSNLRRSRGQAHTHRADLPHMALTHCCFVGPQCLPT